MVSVTIVKCRCPLGLEPNKVFSGSDMSRVNVISKEKFTTDFDHFLYCPTTGLIIKKTRPRLRWRNE